MTYLEDLLFDMDFQVEKLENGFYKVYDSQKKEYRDDELETAEDIIENLELFINDYWFSEITDELYNLGYNFNTWEDIVKLARAPEVIMKLSEESKSIVPYLEYFVHPDKLDGIIKPTLDERLNAYYEEYRIDMELDSIEDAIQSLKEEWGEFGHKGYGIFESDETNAAHICRIDEMDIYDSDEEAARQAEEDGIKLIPHSEIINEYPYNAYCFLDTEENREILKKEKALR